MVPRYNCTVRKKPACFFDRDHTYHTIEEAIFAKEYQL